MKKRKRRLLKIVFTCSKEEYETIRAFARQTTCSSLSAYARNVLMRGPVITTVRNRSIDELIDVLSEIYTTLEELVGKPGWPAHRDEISHLLETISSTVFKIIEQCMPIQN